MSETPALRASDAEREQAVERLRAASAAGRLTLEELSGRVTAAYDARTHEELERLVRDLPEETGAAVAVAPRRRPTRVLISLFGSTTREGRIRIRSLVLCLTTFGNIDLDLRSASLEGDVITILALGTFGAATIRRRVPARRSSASSRCPSPPHGRSGR
jgi:hypothetical protein